ASKPSPAMPVNVAVCGAGAFGRNHLRVYRELEHGANGVTLAAIIESDPARAASLQQEFGAPIFASVEAALAARSRNEVRMDAASICVPTSAHFAAAGPLLSSGIDLLIEKPIASNTKEADDLIALARQHSRILQTGHLERFNPAVLAIQPLLSRPMFSGKVDIANVRLEFDSGCVANFTASRVSTERVRKLRFFQPHQYISIDYARKDVLVIDVNGIPTSAGAAAAAPQPPVAFNKPQVDQAEPL